MTAYQRPKPPLLPPACIAAAETSCPNCAAARLFVVYGLFGAELKRHITEGGGTNEYRLSCHSCNWIEGIGVVKQVVDDVRPGRRAETWGT